MTTDEHDRRMWKSWTLRRERLTKEAWLKFNNDNKEIDNVKRFPISGINYQCKLRWQPRNPKKTVTCKGQLWKIGP